MDTLTASELALIDREGERIKNALSHLIDSFPNHAHSITGMSNWLKASKTTCQRIVETINKPVTGLEAIQLLPGPLGLRKYIDLVQETKIRAELTKYALDSIIHFEELILQYARSHSALKQLIISSQQDSGEIQESEKRKVLHEAAVQLSGESVDTLFYTFIHKENDDDISYLQQYVFGYYDDCQLKQNARPMVFPVLASEDDVEVNSINIIDKDRNSTKPLPVFSIIKDFTSESFLKSTQGATAEADKVVIPTYTGKEAASNIGVIKNYSKDQKSPFHGGKNATVAGVSIRNPTKKLYFLFFLERKFAMRSIANIGTYSSATTLKNMVEDDPAALWYDRFYNEADITLLNSEEVGISKKLNYPIADELLETLFSLTGSDIKDFLCYLLEVDYPIWQTHYRIYFQYAVD